MEIWRLSFVAQWVSVDIGMTFAHLFLFSQHATLSSQKYFGYGIRESVLVLNKHLFPPGKFYQAGCCIVSRLVSSCCSDLTNLNLKADFILFNSFLN